MPMTSRSAMAGRTKRQSLSALGYVGGQMLADSPAKQESWKVMSSCSTTSRTRLGQDCWRDADPHGAEQTNTSRPSSKAGSRNCRTRISMFRNSATHLENLGVFYDSMCRTVSRKFFRQENAQGSGRWWAKYLTDEQQNTWRHTVTAGNRGSAVWHVKRPRCPFMLKQDDTGGRNSACLARRGRFAVVLEPWTYLSRRWSHRTVLMCPWFGILFPAQVLRLQVEYVGLGQYRTMLVTKCCTAPFSIHLWTAGSLFFQFFLGLGVRCCSTAIPRTKAGAGPRVPALGGADFSDGPHRTWLFIRSRTLPHGSIPSVCRRNRDHPRRSCNCHVGPIIANVWFGIPFFATRCSPHGSLFQPNSTKPPPSTAPPPGSSSPK